MDSLKSKQFAWLAWGPCALVVALVLVGMALSLADLAGQPRTSDWVNRVFFGGLAIPIAIIAALILSRQRRNVIGWLLLVPAFMLASITVANWYLETLPQPPPVLTLPLFLLVWYSGWSWLLLIFPLVLIPLFFPTGRPPSVRWGWVAASMAGEAAIFLFIATFSIQLTPAGNDSLTWSARNPIGFLPDPLVNAIIGPWVAILGVLVLLSVASLFARYRQAGAVVRTQIRWLLYACGLFALAYVPGMFWPTETATGEPTLVGLLGNASIIIAVVTIPAAIAIAILRYRLWDIDVIIRRTLIYSALTGILALVYFGSVLGLQPLLTRFTGQGTELTTVLFTLVIAALFAPVRRRVQDFIDRRFYRRRYDAGQTLAAFSAVARDETDLDQLSGQLLSVVNETVQPKGATIWLKPLNGPPHETRPEGIHG